MTRLSSLSKSGKILAPVGLGFSAFVLLGVQSARANYRALVKKPEEKAAESA